MNPKEPPADSHSKEPKEAAASGDAAGGGEKPALASSASAPPHSGQPEPVAIEPRRPKPRPSEETMPLRSPGLSPRTTQPIPAGGAAAHPHPQTQPAARAAAQPETHTPDPRRHDTASHKPPVHARITTFDTQTPGANAGRRSPPPEPPSGIGPVRVLVSGVVVAGLLFTVGNLAYDRGLSDGMKVAAAPKPAAPVPPSLASELEAALESLGKGDAPEALGRLQKLNSEEEAAPLGALKYLVARAAVEAGDLKSARAGIGESIQRGERVSDATALLAMLDLAPGGSPSDVEAARGKLQEAISMDIANPRPHIELARLARAQGDIEGAAAHLHRAAALLDPDVSHEAVEAARTLMRLETLPDDALPAAPEGATKAARRWGALYIALRKGDDAAAAALLAECAAEHPPEIVEAILGDPAFAKFRSRPPLSEIPEKKQPGSEAPSASPPPPAPAASPAP